MVDILGVLNFILSVIIGLLILVVLVVAHELGHALVARRNGVIVEEFGVGFPPRAWGKKIKESFLGKNVLYSVNWLPLGGFVKLQGEHDAADGKGDYGAASLWAKTKILLAGVVMNWLVAALLLSILAATSGIPKILPGQFQMPGDTGIDRQPVVITNVVKGSPAEKAGIAKGDEVRAVAGQQVYSSLDLTALTRQYAGQTVDIAIKNKAGEKAIRTTLNPATVTTGMLGVSSGQKRATTYRSTWSAPITGVALTGQFTGYTLSELGNMLVKLGSGLVDKINPNATVREQGNAKLGQVGDSVGGPVAILGVLFPSAREAGPASLTLAAALISLTLAVMNILPIPALDGGRWFVTMLYRVVLRKPLTKEKEEKIHGTGMLVLLGLIVLITVLDVQKLL